MQLAEDFQFRLAVAYGYALTFPNKQGQTHLAFLFFLCSWHIFIKDYIGI